MEKKEFKKDKLGRIYSVATKETDDPCLPYATIIELAPLDDKRKLNGGYVRIKHSSIEKALESHSFYSNHSSKKVLCCIDRLERAWFV